MKILYPKPRGRKYGFSLVEMLIVIAIIGVIAAIAIPNIGLVQTAGKDARNRRNAQSIAAIYSAAQVAGLDFSKGLTAKEDIIKAVITGGTVQEGDLAGASFKVPADLVRDTSGGEGAAEYLEWDGTSRLLIYKNVK